MRVPFPRGLAAFAAALAPLVVATPGVASPAAHSSVAFQGTPPAQDTAPGAQGQQTPGNQTVSFDVKDRDLVEIIEFIRKRADVNIVVAPNIQEKVTLSLKDVDWKQ